MKKFNQIFGVWNFELPSENEIEIPTEVIALAEERLKARKAKDFKTADALREKIMQMGFIVIDTKDGYLIKK